MEFRGLMGGFYRISEWIMRLSAINLLWILCSIPFFFFALAGLTSGQADIMMQSLVLMGILAPFTLFPSTAAMFTVARKWVTGDEDVPLFKTFFRGYKENFLQSMIGGIAFVLFALILFVSYRFYAGLDSALSLLSYMFLAMGILLIGAFFNFFCIMSHLHMKVLQIIKNAILLTIGNPVTSVMTIIGNVAIVIISFRFSFLLVFFAGSVSATFSFWQFNRSFEKIKRKQEAVEEAEREREQEENGQAAELDAAAVREDDSTKKESDKL